jgi:hypothetical protein
MNKTENIKSKNDPKKTQYVKNQYGRILWWMQKGRNSIYVEFMSGIGVI